MPRMAREILRTIASDVADVEIVDDIPHDVQAVERAREERVDVIVAQHDGLALAPAYAELLDEQPHLRVIAVAADGRHGSVYEMRRHRQSLGALGPDDLQAAIRGARRAATQPA
jgi:hypothetical protein